MISICAAMPFLRACPAYASTISHMAADWVLPVSFFTALLKKWPQKWLTNTLRLLTMTIQAMLLHLPLSHDLTTVSLSWDLVLVVYLNAIVHFLCSLQSLTCTVSIRVMNTSPSVLNHTAMFWCHQYRLCWLDDMEESFLLNRLVTFNPSYCSSWFLNNYPSSNMITVRW